MLVQSRGSAWAEAQYGSIVFALSFRGGFLGTICPPELVWKECAQDRKYMYGTQFPVKILKWVQYDTHGSETSVRHTAWSADVVAMGTFVVVTAAAVVAARSSTLWAD